MAILSKKHKIFFQLTAIEAKKSPATGEAEFTTLKEPPKIVFCRLGEGNIKHIKQTKILTVSLFQIFYDSEIYSKTVQRQITNAESLDVRLVIRLYF